MSHPGNDYLDDLVRDEQELPCHISKCIWRLEMFGPGSHPGPAKPVDHYGFEFYESEDAARNFARKWNEKTGYLARVEVIDGTRPIVDLLEEYAGHRQAF
mgnify:CR=1 FL=1|tara:strand:+ start:133 stop:432 length:300 start_codon:yes stop_codon:yes gene_type:complete